MEARNGGGVSEELTLNGDGLSIPLGGPIYAPNLVGPLTRVPHFESSLLQELQVLLICIYNMFLFQYSNSSTTFTSPCTFVSTSNPCFLSRVWRQSYTWIHLNYVMKIFRMYIFLSLVCFDCFVTVGFFKLQTCNHYFAGLMGLRCLLKNSY